VEIGCCVDYVLCWFPKDQSVTLNCLLTVTVIITIVIKWISRLEVGEPSHNKDGHGSVIHWSSVGCVIIIFQVVTCICILILVDCKRSWKREKRQLKLLHTLISRRLKLKILRYDRIYCLCKNLTLPPSPLTYLTALIIYFLPKFIIDIEFDIEDPDVCIDDIFILSVLK
jgi:hypothetical protein